MRAIGLQTTILSIGLVLAGTSCGTFGGGGGEDTPVATAPSSPVSDEAGDREARLREAVDNYIQSTSEASSESSGRLMNKKPYYFKK